MFNTFYFPFVLISDYDLRIVEYFHLTSHIGEYFRLFCGNIIFHNVEIFKSCSCCPYCRIFALFPHFRVPLHCLPDFFPQNKISLQMCLCYPVFTLLNFGVIPAQWGQGIRSVPTTPHCLQNTNGRQGAPKWLTGSGKVSTPWANPSTFDK